MSNGVNFRKLSLDLRDQLNQVTAEREALQLLLNNRDDLDDQLTSLEQRRYAEQQAREAAERRVEELAALLRRSRRYVESAWPDGVHSYRRNSIGGDLLSDIDTALNPTAEAVGHVDCGSCRNITDGCKGTCQRSEEWSKP